MSTAPIFSISPAEYLEKQRLAEFKSEYIQGQVVAMAGGSFNHAVIIGNVTGELREGLKQSAYTVTSSDLRLAIPGARLYTYPDVMVICGEPVFADDRLDTILNPVVIVEVLSNSTQSYDRKAEFEHYRAINSLRDYVMVSQDKAHVTDCVRQAENRWLLTDYAKAEDSIRLESVGIELRLADAYLKVRF